MIDERLEAYHRNPDLGSPWEDVYKRIVAKQFSSQQKELLSTVYSLSYQSRIRNISLLH